MITGWQQRGKKNFAAIKGLSGFLPLNSGRANFIAFNWAPFFLNKFVEKKPVSATGTFKRGLCTLSLSVSLSFPFCLPPWQRLAVFSMWGCLDFLLAQFGDCSLVQAQPSSVFSVSLNMTGTREQTCIFCGFSQLKGNLSNRQRIQDNSLRLKLHYLKCQGEFFFPLAGGLYGRGT